MSTAAGAEVLDVKNRPRTRGASPFRQFLRRMRRQRFAMIFVAILVFAVLVAIFGPSLAPHDPRELSPPDRFGAPSAAHWLGNDEMGRDMLSRLIHGTRLSLEGALIAVVVSFGIGVPLGLISGYAGGWVDGALMRGTDAVMTFPSLILAISIVGILGPSLTNAMIAVGITFYPRFARIVRGATLSVREETYIEAARSLGIGDVSIILRHIVPNITSPLIVQTTLSLALAITNEAALSFLGLGAQAPDASLGSLLNTGFRYGFQAPLNVVTPGVAIVLLILAFNIVGDAMRDAIGREMRTKA